jgi:hypothetical protein
MKIWALPIAVISLALVASGCGGGGSSLFSGPTVPLAFINASPDVTFVDLEVDGTTVFANSAYGNLPATNDYQRVPQGSATYRAQVPNSSTTYLGDQLNLFDQNRSYILIFGGYNQPPQNADIGVDFILAPNNIGTPPANKANARVVHAIPNVNRNYDVYINSPSVSLPGSPSANKDDLTFGDVRNYSPYDAQTYRIAVTDDDNNSIISSSNYTFQSGVNYTIVLVDFNGNVAILVVPEA